MPTRPTDLPLAWATDAGARVAVSDPYAAAGAVPGQPVPAKANNTLWGRLSDFARFFALSVVSGCTYQGFLITGVSPNWFPVDAGGGVGDSVITYPDFRMQVTTGPTGDRQASARVDPVMAGGTVSAVTINIPTLSTTSGTPTASVQIAGFDVTGLGPAVGTYSANITTTGDLVLPLTSGTATVYGPLLILITVRAGTTTGDFLTVGSVTVEY